MEVPRFEVREGRNGEGKGARPVSCPSRGLPSLCVTALAWGHRRLLLLALRVGIGSCLSLVMTRSEEGGIVLSALFESGVTVQCEVIGVSCTDSRAQSVSGLTAWPLPGTAVLNPAEGGAGFCRPPTWLTIAHLSLKREVGDEGACLGAAAGRTL